jgi:formate dehydrogenase alpha subunit
MSDKEMSYRLVPSTCVYCGTGCGVLLEVTGGCLTGTLPQKDHPVSGGSLCIKGWSLHEFVYSEHRLTRPMVRSGGELVETDWDTALQAVADGLAAARERGGPDSVGFFTSARCTNEENYLLQKLARAVVGTNNVDHCARLCHASTVAGLATAFGSGAMTNSIGDLADAGVILVVGSNTTEQHPIIGERILAAVRKGVKLIVIDPRSIHLSGFADIYLRPRPGSDVAFINGMINAVISEGLQDSEFIASRTEGFEDLKKAVAEFTPQRVEEISGIPAEELVAAARLYAGAERASIVYCMGITQHTTGTDNVLSLANLALLTGNVGKPGTGVNPLRGQNNVQGACDLGGLPNVYPAYQKVNDEEVARRFEEAWGVEGLPRQPGLTITEMIEKAATGELKALFIMGENPMVSDPDINHVREALQGIDFLVVADIMENETMQYAHVVLPAASFAEKDGTFTNTERRVQRIREAVEPVGESRADWEIVCLLGKKMGAAGFDFASPEEVFEEMRKVTPSYAGMTYERLGTQGLQWPCPTEDHPGTPILHAESFPIGKGRFTPCEYREPAETPDADYPLVLTTGRLHFHFHTGTMTRRSPSLVREINRSFVEVNPADAVELGISDGEQVKVSSRRGSVEVDARVTERVGKGVIFMPFHFAEAAANLLTNPALDPVAKIPELKVCAARLSK